MSTTRARYKIEKDLIKSKCTDKQTKCYEEKNKLRCKYAFIKVVLRAFLPT